jgi:hypothetical protein
LVSARPWSAPWVAYPFNVPPVTFLSQAPHKHPPHSFSWESWPAPWWVAIDLRHAPLSLSTRWLASWDSFWIHRCFPPTPCWFSSTPTGVRQ